MAAHQFEAIAKKLVLLANFLFIGAGIALIVVGADADPIPVFDAGVDFGIGFAVLGGVLLGCAALGIVAAVTGKRGLLTGYNILLSLIVFTQIALASVFFSPFQVNIRDEIVTDVRTQVLASRDAFDLNPTDDGLNADLTDFSLELECCGWDITEAGAPDNAYDSMFPQMATCGDTAGAPDEYARECNFGDDDTLDVCDCIRPTEARLDDVMTLMASVAMGTAMFELIVLFLTCGMAWVFHVKIEQDPTNVSYHR